MRKSLYILIVVLILSTSTLTPAGAQASDTVDDWLSAVNQARLDNSLPPYRHSQRLSTAAQRHADDVFANGFSNQDDVHLGSDGTHEQERVIDTGYTPWMWNSGAPIVDENMWSGYGSIEDAMDFFLGSSVHRANILSDRYREIGIGIAGDGGASYYVLVFSVRPNILPIFINEGAATTNDAQVAIRLTNEYARPDGDGTGKMGQAVEVRLSDEPDWDGQAWQSWAELVPWTLPQVAGEHTVYVQFRDGAGRTADSFDTITLQVEGLPTSTPEPTATPVPPTATPEPTATSEPTSPPTPTPPVPTPTPAPTLAPTPTALPTSTAILPSPISQPAGATPFPTWTPLPSPAPETKASGSSLSCCLGVAVTLQGLVVLLGLTRALRRDGNGLSARVLGSNAYE